MMFSTEGGDDGGMYWPPVQTNKWKKGWVKSNTKPQIIATAQDYPPNFPEYFPAQILL